MDKLEESLDEAGFNTINCHYPSTKFEIHTLAIDTISEALSNVPSNENVHFVTHSMGGILVRQYLSFYKIENLGRVVMLGPPNQGSEVVDRLMNVPGFKLLHGPAGTQLGTGQFSVPNQLGPANFEVGIIAGTRSINLVLSQFLPGKDDGKVSVESTKLEGMKDHIEMPATHPFMMRNEKVIDEVIHFLQQGVFHR